MEFRVNDTGECQFQAEGLSMRRVGLRRPRDHNERLGESGVCFGEAKILELACDGKDSDPGMIHGRRVRLMATGKTSGLRREGKGAISASRPELVFFVQALLSFVGIVVIPARLSYEFLIVRSHVTDNGSQQPGSSYAPWVPDVSVARHQNVNEPPRTFARIILEAFKGDVGPNFYEGGRYGDSSLERTSRRSGSRVLMQTDEEDEGESFTYTARTKFYLCSDQSVALNEDELRGNITNIFGVDEGNVNVESDSTEFCTDPDNEWSVEIDNEGDGDKSAAAISAEQMESVRSGDFTQDLANAVSTNELVVSASDFTVYSLGYVILYDEDQTPSPAADGLGSDFVSVAGPDQWWPDWSWAIVGVGLVLALCCLGFGWYYRPKRSDPPSPSGAGGGGSSHGSGGKGAKGGFNKGYLDAAFNKDYPDEFDKATGVSMDSPYDYPRADSVFDDDDSHTSDVGVQAMPKQGSALPAEPDRGAGGVEPVRTCDDGAADASTANAAAAAVAAAAAYSSSTTGDVNVGDSENAESPEDVGKIRGLGPAEPSGRSLMEAYPSSTTGDVYLGDSENAESPEDVGKIRGLGPAEPSGRSLVEAASVLADSENFGSNHSTFRGSISSDIHTLVPVPPAAEKGEEDRREETALMPSLADAPAPGPSSDDRSRPSSRRSSSGSSGRFFSSEPVGTSGGVGVGVVRHTRGDAQGSSEADRLRKELTDEERQVRAQESDAARAASLLRGASFRVPLQPDLERAITKEEQERRREAIREVERQRAPGLAAAPVIPALNEGVGKDEDEEKKEKEEGGATSSPLTSVAGKMLSSMRGLFNLRSEDPAAALTEAAPEDAEIPRVDEDESEIKVHCVAATAATADEPGDGTVEEGEVRSVLAHASEPVSWPSGAEGEEMKDEATLLGPPLIPLDMRTAGAVGGVIAGAAVVPKGDRGGSDDAPRTFGPEEKQAYSDNVDRTLERLPVVEEGRGEGQGEEAASMPMSELLARADLEEIEAKRGDPPQMQALASSAPAPVAETVTAPDHFVGLPPAGRGQAAAAGASALQQPQQQQQRPGLGSGSAAAAPPLHIVSLIQNVEEGGISLEQLEENLASPIVATPPALLRPGVGPAARGANSRGRNLLNRQSISGSFVSSRSTSVTEDVGSNPALTEDDMSSDAQTTDVSRTSSYLAGGSSFEEGLAQAQAASGHFQGSGSSGGVGAGARAGSGAHESGGGGGGGAQGAAGGAHVTSLAEQLARAEETVGREHEKGLLYRQGPEKVAAVVTGEDLPVPGGGAPGGGDAEDEGEEKIESLAEMLKKADDGPGNLKDMFRRLDEMEAKRLEELNAAAAAEGADDETKARWRGSLAELMLKVDRAGNLREFIDPPSEGEGGSSGTQPSARSDSTQGTGATWRPEARPE